MKATGPQYAVTVPASQGGEQYYFRPCRAYVHAEVAGVVLTEQKGVERAYHEKRKDYSCSAYCCEYGEETVGRGTGKTALAPHYEREVSPFAA